VEGVVEGALELVDDVLGAAAQEDADGLRVAALGDEGELVVADLALLDAARGAQVALRENLSSSRSIADARVPISRSMLSPQPHSRLYSCYMSNT
jgi:hypothetical protein